MLEETRRGLVVMSALALVLLGAEAVLYARLDLGSAYLYTSALLAVLAVNVLLSARAVSEIRALHLLGMSLLVVSCTAMVLLAHQTGVFSSVLFASVALLFMVVPLVPWGLREASIVTALIYGAVTASTLTTQSSFDAETLWTLQLVMVGAGLVSLVLVARNVTVRKDDIRKRFDLERANHKILALSNKDALTGAWNRRFLKSEFPKRVSKWRERGQTFHFAFMDLDDFKPLNDTYGHDCGDKVLQWTTGVFGSLLQDKGCLVRMGGDEFSLLFTADDPEALLEAGLREIRSLAAGDEYCGSAQIGLSVGIVSVDSGVDADQGAIYKRADEALYEAKAGKEPGADRPNLVRYRWCADNDPTHATVCNGASEGITDSPEPISG
jgi:diguanylate cyclase (GGDEF)-like protein